LLRTDDPLARMACVEPKLSANRTATSARLSAGMVRSRPGLTQPEAQLALAAVASLRQPARACDQSVSSRPLAIRGAGL